MSNDTNDTNPSSSNPTPAEIIAAARDWGAMHGRLLATDDDIRQAVLADDDGIDWLDYPDLMWDGITVWIQGCDLASLDPDELDSDLVAAAEAAAEEAAREEGERVIVSMTRDELLALIMGDQPEPEPEKDDDQGAGEV